MNKIQLEYRDIESIIPYGNNVMDHSEEQVEAIAKSIQEYGFNNPVLLDSDGLLVAGHGRLMAAKSLGMQELPCLVLGHLSDAQRRAYAIADNKIPRQSTFNLETLSKELEALALEEIDLSAMAFSAKELDAILSSSPTLPDELSYSLNYTMNSSKDRRIEDQEYDQNGRPIGGKYTTKINTPVYEVKNEKPDISDLFDDSRTNKLISQIEKSDIPDKDKQFLKIAAKRHTVFNYQHIADYYAHSSKQVQNLMEEQYLVIIDFQRAYELGYIKLAEEIAQFYFDTHGE